MMRADESQCRPAASPIPVLAAAIAATLLVAPASSFAQRARENAVTSAADGFGATVGNERVGVYTTTNVRGFSPITAGNRRLDGLYFDLGGNGLTNRLYSRSTVRVGLPALAYPFPAPSGIVDYDLRKPTGSTALGLLVARTVYGGSMFELDGQRPLGDRLSLAGGIGGVFNTYADGRSTDARSAALIPTLEIGDATWTAFAGYSDTGGSVPPIMVTSGPVLPPDLDTRRFHAQPWIDNKQVSRTFGLHGVVPLAPRLDLRVGVFDSRSTRERTYANLFLDVQPDGTSREVVVSDPRLPARWTSGEVRLDWQIRQGATDHRIILAARGRDKRLESGGSGSAELGPAIIGRLTPAPRPDFVYAAPTVNEVRQGSIGVAYIGHLPSGWDFNIGLQRLDYRSDFTAHGGLTRTLATPWIYNATVAYAPSARVGFYAGLATGLEESAPAPASAANRDDAVPASETRQYDAGVRLVLGEVRLVAGVFQLERPYYSIDADNLYRALGDLRNRGIEISLAGALTPRLSVVSGLVLADPRVIGEAFEAGRTGRRPVAATTRLARLDAEYVVPALEGLSLTASSQHSSAVVASTGTYAALGDRQLEVPAGTTHDLGFRYRFVVKDVPVALRAQVLNVFDTQRPVVSSSNVFLVSERRRFMLQLTADF
jgi:iron complex outermembrane recepter protein